MMFCMFFIHTNLNDCIEITFTYVVLLNREEEEIADSLTIKPIATVDKIVVRTDDFHLISLNFL